MTVNIAPENIAKARRAAGISQLEMARRLGVHNTTLNVAEKCVQPGGILDRAAAEIMAAIAKAASQN